MLLVFLILGAALAAGAVSLWKVWMRYSASHQRSWLFRVGVFGLFGLLLVGALIVPLPNKHRLLAIVPAFFLAVVFTKVVRSGWARLRATPPPPDLERMKRLN